MGCGKSSVGKELSRLLCCPFIDLDSVIEERAGRSIPEIFASDGEAAFRRMELEALRSQVEEMGHLGRSLLPVDSTRTLPERDKSSLHEESTRQEYLVLALGGGAVMTKECAELVHEKTLCIYLRASVDTLVSHLAAEADGRPMLRTSSKGGDSGTSSQEAKQKSSSTESLKNMRQNLQARIEELMSVRSTTYESTAHIIIDTNGKSVTEVAKEIMRRLNLSTGSVER